MLCGERYTGDMHIRKAKIVSISNEVWAICSYVYTRSRVYTRTTVAYPAHARIHFFRDNIEFIWYKGNVSVILE